MNVMYVVVPNHVKSSKDGQKRWVTGAQLVKLYRLHKAMHLWRVAGVHAEDPPEERQRKVELITQHHHPADLRLLEPRFDGVYRQPAPNREYQRQLPELRAFRGEDHG